MKYSRIVWFVTALLGSVACGPGTASEDPAVLACDAVRSTGSSKGITATPERKGSPVLASGVAHMVSLPAGGSGFVHIEASRTLLLFAKSQDAVTALYRGDETTSKLPEAGPNEFCPTFLDHWELALTEAGEWFIELGSVEGEQVWLLVETSARHAHDDDHDNGHAH